MDASPEESHLRPTWRCARDVVASESVSCPSFFFFFSQLAPMRCKLQPIHADSGRIGRNLQIQVKIKKKKKKTFLSVRSYLYLNSHLQLSLTLWSLCSTPRLSGLCSLSPLSHTISLLTHSHTHIISLSRVSTLNSLTLCSPSPFRYQSQAFNLSFP